MNLQELRERFVKGVGSTRLVEKITTGGVTRPDYSRDNGADYYINEGVRLLDEVLPYPGSFSSFEVEIEAGDYKISVPRLRSLERVAVVQDATPDTPNDLRIRSIKELYDFYYGQAIPTLTQGIPALVARGPAEGTTGTTYGDELLTNASFEAATGWELGDDWSISGGAASIAAGADSIERLLIQYLDTSVVGANAQVSFSVTFSNTPGTETNRLWFDIGSRSNGELQLGSVIATGTYTVTVRLREFDFISLRAGSDFVGSVTVLSVKQLETTNEPTIWFSPPADGTYTLQLWGNRWTEKLEQNTDTNFWAHNHPGLVILAAMIWHEIELRNSSGAREWKAELNERIQKLDFDEAEQNTNYRKYPYP